MSRRAFDWKKHEPGGVFPKVFSSDSIQKSLKKGTIRYIYIYDIIYICMFVSHMQFPLFGPAKPCAVFRVWRVNSATFPWLSVKHKQFSPILLWATSVFLSVSHIVILGWFLDSLFPFPIWRQAHLVLQGILFRSFLDWLMIGSPWGTYLRLLVEVTSSFATSRPVRLVQVFPWRNTGETQEEIP